MSIDDADRTARGVDAPDDDDWEDSDLLPRRTRRWWVPAVIVLVAVVAVGFPFLLGGGGGTETSTTTTTPGQPSGPIPVRGGFVTHRDEKTGFTIKRPKNWEILASPHEEVRLLLTAGGVGDSVQIRVDPAPPDTPSDVAVAAEKIFTEQVEAAGPKANIRVSSKAPVTANGLPGYSYVYAFYDERNAMDGIHIHHFFFQRGSVYSLVFQALPSEDLRQLAPVFDEMASSFRIEPGPASSAPPTTTR